MYKLKVIKHLDHPDGRIFEPGHDCDALDAFEVAELVNDYPDYFEAGDDLTGAFLENKDNIAHLAGAVVRKRKEMGELKAVKK
jgi:hypothetical protein